jgi:hypothetical protein
MPNPIENESLYDAILLAGKRSPGHLTLSGHDRNQKWDVKDADGSGGASTTYKGEQIAQFTAAFYLVFDPVLGIDEFAEWATFAALIRSTLPSKGQPKALDIYHPDLAANDIKSVCQASIGGMTHDGRGGATVVVKFIEYRPPKKKGGSPSGSKTAATTKVDPNADLKARVADLLVEAKKPPVPRAA